jgi:hypothetical protein
MTQEATYRARYWLDLCVSVAVVAAGISFAIGSSGSPVVLTFGVLLILAGGAQTVDWLWSRLNVSDQALTLRKVWGTKAYPWSTIERVEVEAKSWRQWGNSRSVPVIVFQTGQRRRLWFLSGPGVKNRRVRHLARTITADARLVGGH